MKIKEVVVSAGLTVNLGNYQSSRVDVSLTAQLDEGESATNALEQLQEQAREWAEAEADRVLEQHGCAARYSNERRFRVLAARTNRTVHRAADHTPGNVVLVVPMGFDLGDMTEFYHVPTLYIGEARIDTIGLRLRHAHEVAERWAAWCAEHTDRPRIIEVRSSEDLPALRPVEEGE